MYDLTVIGAGPAGLAAAIYAVRKKLKLLLLTKDFGGKTNLHLELPWIHESESVPGVQLVTRFRTELEQMDFARHLDEVQLVTRQNGGFSLTTRKGTTVQTRAVIIATGSRQVNLGVPGEKQYTMKGLCYSAASYAPLFVDKTGIVIGDGELALRSAAELATTARRVYVVCSDDRMLDSALGARLRASRNVISLGGHEVVEVKGDEYARTLVLKDRQGKTISYDADAIFVEKALAPNSEMVRELVQLDETGRIVIDGANRTNVAGVFAAGDVTNGFAELVIIAMGEGARAALSAYDYLLGIGQQEETYTHA